jgi:hypothetical protein
LLKVMTNLARLDRYLSSVQFNPLEFGHLSIRQLNQLSSAFSGYPISDPSVEALRMRYIEKNTEDERKMFKLFITSLKQKKQKGQVLESGRIEETAHQKGSQVYYSAGQVAVKTKAGELISFKNSVVPEPEILTRPKAGLLTSFVLRCVGMDAGALVSNVEKNNSFQVAFAAPKSSISIAGMAEFSLYCMDFLADDASMKNMALQDKLSLTGSKWISFVSRWVNTCEWKVFWTLQTLIVVKCLRVFASYVRKDGKARLGHRLRFDRQLIVEAEFFSCSTKGIPDSWALPADSESYQGACEALEYLGVIAFYRGGAHKFQTAVPSAEPKFVDVKKSITDGEALRGGNKSAISIFSATVGFSGIPTNTYRDAHLFFCAVFSAVFTHNSVDVVLDSSNYIDPLIATLLDNRALLFKDLGGDNLITEEKVRDYVRFVLPFPQFPTDAAKRNWCSTSCRPSTYRVLRADPSLPVFNDTTPLKDIAVEGCRSLSVVEGSGGYTMFTKVFGSEIFNQSFVYRYGRSGALDAVVSSDSKLTWWGVGIDFVDLSPRLVKVKHLSPFLTESDYYSAILKENLFRNGYFLTPSSQYSPISNIMVVRTKGVSTAEGDVDYKDQIADHTHSWDACDDYGDEEEEHVDGEFAEDAVYDSDVEVHSEDEGDADDSDDAGEYQSPDAGGDAEEDPPLEKQVKKRRSAVGVAPSVAPRRPQEEFKEKAPIVPEKVVPPVSPPIHAPSPQPIVVMLPPVHTVQPLPASVLPSSSARGSSTSRLGSGRGGFVKPPSSVVSPPGGVGRGRPPLKSSPVKEAQSQKAFDDGDYAD